MMEFMFCPDTYSVRFITLSSGLELRKRFIKVFLTHESTTAHAISAKNKNLLWSPEDSLVRLKQKYRRGDNLVLRLMLKYF